MAAAGLRTKAMTEIRNRRILEPTRRPVELLNYAPAAFFLLLAAALFIF
jgi:hypothetical protein